MPVSAVSVEIDANLNSHRKDDRLEILCQTLRQQLLQELEDIIFELTQLTHVKLYSTNQQNKETETQTDTSLLPTSNVSNGVNHNSASNCANDATTANSVCMSKVTVESPQDPKAKLELFSRRRSDDNLMTRKPGPGLERSPTSLRDDASANWLGCTKGFGSGYYDSEVGTAVYSGQREKEESKPVFMLTSNESSGYVPPGYELLTGNESSTVGGKSIDFAGRDVPAAGRGCRLAQTTGWGGAPWEQVRNAISAAMNCNEGLLNKAVI